jgi:hypothetical protein
LYNLLLLQDNLLVSPPLGSSVSFLHHNDINSANFNFEGTKTSGEKSKKENLINSAFMYLGTFGVVKLPLWYQLLWFYTNGLQTHYHC